MKFFASLIAASLSVAIGAQTQTLVVNATGVGLTYGAAGANFLDLVVTSPTGITLRALNMPVQNAAGTVGAIELWINRTQSTHVGFEQLGAAPAPSGDPSGWELLTSGNFVSGGLGVVTETCQSAFTINVPDTFLATGTYPLAIVYEDVFHQFTGVVAWPQPAGTFADANIEATNGATQATPWTTAPLVNFTYLGTLYQGCVGRYGILYDVGQVPHACSSKSSFGEGSIRNSGSFFQLFEDTPTTQAAAAASAALQGRSMTFVPTGTGYNVIPGVATYVPPTAAAIALPVADDQETQITTVLPIVYPDNQNPANVTFDLFVHSNGYVSTSAQSALGFSPFDPALQMNADATAWYSHHDFNNAELGSTGANTISWEENIAAGIVYITWDGVESYPDTVSNPSTIQFQFDTNTGFVTIIWQSIDATGGSTIFAGDNTLIGWSPGGDSPTTDPFDINTLTSQTYTLPELIPLTLELVGDALVGQSIDLTTTNEVGSSIGINLISESLLAGAPVSLSFLGTPASTSTWLDATLSVPNLISNIPGVGTMTLTIPIANIPSLAGITIYSQSFWFDLASPNLFTNLLSSNAVQFVVGNF